MVWDYKTANINALNDTMNVAPWHIPYTLFDDLGDIVNINKVISRVFMQRHQYWNKRFHI